MLNKVEIPIIFIILISIIIIGFGKYMYTKGKDTQELIYMQNILSEQQKLETKINNINSQSSQNTMAINNLTNNINSHIQTNAINLHKELQDYEKSLNNGSTQYIDARLRSIYNQAVLSNANMPTVSESTNIFDGISTAITTTKLIDNTIINYAICNQAINNNIQWQNWIKQQQAIYNKGVN